MLGCYRSDDSHEVWSQWRMIIYKTSSQLDLVLGMCICGGICMVLGSMGWLVSSEICPLEIRSAGQAINVSVNMLFTFIIDQVFLSMLCHLKLDL
ncbi:hypothetical protein FF1_043199 [Malus domestica]